MRVEGKNSVTHMKMDKPKLNKYASKASTDVSYLFSYLSFCLIIFFLLIIQSFSVPLHFQQEQELLILGYRLIIIIVFVVKQ